MLVAALFPTAFFLLAPFSESLFLALSVGSLLAARRHRLVVAGVLGGLAALTRPVGVLLAVPLLVEAVADARLPGSPARPRLRPGHLAALVPLLAGGGFVLVTMRALDVGSPFGAEALWDTHAAWPWVAFRDSAGTVAGDPVEVVNLIAVVALPLLTVAMVGRLPAAYVAYSAAACLAVCCNETAGRLQSSARYLVVVFPVHVLIAVVGERPRVRRALLVASAAVMTVLFVHTVRGSFVG